MKGEGSTNAPQEPHPSSSSFRRRLQRRGSGIFVIYGPPGDSWTR